MAPNSGSAKGVTELAALPAVRGDVEVALAEQRESFVSVPHETPDGGHVVFHHGSLVAERIPALNPVLPGFVAQAEFLVEPESFKAYVTAYKSPTAIVRAYPPVFETEQQKQKREARGGELPVPRFVGVLDYHGRAREGEAVAAVPGRCLHEVTLNCPFSIDYLKWRGILAGGYLDQKKMIEHVEDMIHTVLSPNAGDLLDSLGSVAVDRVTKFKSARNDRSGTVKILFDETDAETDRITEHGASLPDQIELVLPIYQGGMTQRLVAKLRYRLAGNQLFLGFHVPGLDGVEREAFRTIGDDISDSTGTPVFYCS